DLPEDDARCALGGREEADDDWLAWNLGRHRASARLGDRPPPAQRCFDDS
ncbi:MAG: hypothetical protein JWM84_2280, partial [Nocardioides sp.]|nr:hypothetical protein [Nocardioides sp.]